MNKGNCCSTPPTHVVVVESHQHALEHYHAVIRLRRRKRNHSLTETWSMLHFDAHPDLACPGSHIPAAACFTPRKPWPAHVASGKELRETGRDSEGENVIDQKDLYELLDSTSSGIAEWILPLALAGDLKSVEWIRSYGSNQLPLGQCSFRVGAWVPHNERNSSCEVSSFLDLPFKSTVKVELDHPYYCDDSSVVPSDELMLPQLVHLTVSELPIPANGGLESAVISGDRQLSKQSQENETSSSRDDWALDICLDYFACLNPFLTDLEACDPVFAKALLDAVCKTRFHRIAMESSFPHAESVTTGMDSVIENGISYEQELFAFRSCIKELLQQSVSQDGKCSSTAVADCEPFDARRFRDELATLVDFYESEEEGRVILNALLRSLSLNDSLSELAAMALDAIPNITMPHHPKDAESMKQSAFGQLEGVAQHIFQIWSDRGVDPFIITFARSSADGFTPGSIVDDLQSALIHRLHSMFCGCNQLATIADTAHISPEHFSDESQNCRWKVIFDYGTKWEGSSFDER